MKNLFSAVFLIMCSVLSLHSADQNSMQKDAFARLYSSVSRIKAEDVKTVLVIPFEYSKEVTMKTAEDAVASTLARTGKYRVIDKKSMKELLEQQKLSISGLTEETEARKIGKLLSADAVVFGTSGIQGEKMVVSLTMKDVTTGALIWADTFEGEDLTRIYFGPGIRSGFFNSSLPITLTLPGTFNQAIVQPPDINNGFFFAFSFSYVQRLQDVKAISFGLDGVFYRGFAQFDNLAARVTDGANQYDFTSSGNYTDLKLNLCTLVRIHLGPLLDLGNDFLIFYAGPGLDGNYVLCDTKYRLTQTAGAGSFDSGEISYAKNIGEALAFGGVTFRAGLEMRFTTAFSVFVEAYYIPSFTYSFNDVSANIIPKWTVGPGQNFYGMGMRYLIF